MELTYATIQTPVGELAAAFSPAGLLRIELPRDGLPAIKLLERRFPGLPRRDGGGDAGALRSQLGEYFDCRRREFDLALDLRGTLYRMRVWEEMQRIPYGSTVSYGELAVRIGGHARAVGTASAHNQIPIIIPCHRVVAADGSLRGYGGGLPMKRFLLSLEGAPVADQESLFSAGA